MPFEFTPRDLMGGEPGFSFSGVGAGGGGGAAMAGSSLDINFAAGTWGANLGPDLLVNGGFNNDLSGWVNAPTPPTTIVWSAGQALWQTDGVSQGRLRQGFATVIGVMYEVTKNGTAGIGYNIGTASGLQDILPDSNVAGVHTRRFIATTTTTWVNTFGVTNNATLDYVSVRQVNPQALGPEKIVNGTFTTDLTGWTVGVGGTSTGVWSAGRAVLTADGTNAVNLDQAIATVAGQQYQLVFESISLTSGGYAYSVGTTQGGTNIVNVGGQTAIGVRTVSFIALGTTTYVRVRKSGDVGAWTVDNVSVMEVSPPIERILTTTRSSPGMAQRLDGSWQDFAANVPRITDRGLLVEEARTNSIRNSTMQGAVVGSPGTFPTNWNLANSSGLTGSVVAKGVQDGIDYVDLRVQGTPPATTTFGIEFDSLSTAAVDAQTWTPSAFFALLAGAFPAQPQVDLIIRGASDAFLTDMFTAAPITATLTRFSGTKTIANATTTGVRFRLAIAVTISVPVDFTLRVGWPQLELGAFATSPIKTTSAAVTRALDQVRCPTGAWYNEVEGTFTAKYNRIVITPTNAQAACSMCDNSTVNRIGLFNESGLPNAVARIVAASTGYDPAGLTGVVPVGRHTAAVAYKVGTNGGGFCVDNSVVNQSSPAALPTRASLAAHGLEMGSQAAFYHLNGYLERVTHYPTRLTNAELQALTA